jgi:hypothetical protein
MKKTDQPSTDLLKQSLCKGKCVMTGPTDPVFCLVGGDGEEEGVVNANLSKTMVSPVERG